MLEKEAKRKPKTVFLYMVRLWRSAMYWMEKEHWTLKNGRRSIRRYRLISRKENFLASDAVSECGTAR